jgi:hypothetical protein
VTEVRRRRIKKQSKVMSECLVKSDFQTLGKSMLEGFDRRVASIPNDLCAPFHGEARQLETELLTLHKMVTLCVRREEDLTNVSIYWDAMVRLCDNSAKHLGKLVANHPYCGAQVYYDRILDLRNKCHRLQQMHS